MGRETVKQLAIAMYEDALNVYERDDIAFMAPYVGKYTWTYMANCMMLQLQMLYQIT